MSKPGVFTAQKKDGTIYYRSSITYKGKHISLGSYQDEETACQAHNVATEILHSDSPLQQYHDNHEPLSFSKTVSLINYRDNSIYIKNPIYLYKHFFIYYLDDATPLKFDIEDLFYYSTHKIQKRGNYLFVADYGMQTNILNRYGIKNYAVCGRDYRHRNNDELDFTYSNIEIINAYYGVTSIDKNGHTCYRTIIHINGNYTVGTYRTETEAAIAYNKAVDIVHKKGCRRFFQTNYILSLSASEYAKLYHQVTISDKIIQLIFPK